MRATRFVLRSAPLRPRTLSSGPESGLCNQLFALIGYVMMAHEQNRSLVLPHVDAHSDDLFRLWAMCRAENGSWISLPGERPGARKNNARGICSFGWCDQTAMLMLRSRRAVVEHRPDRR